MAVYKRVVKAQDNSSMYLNVTENKEVAADKLDPALKEELDIADPNTEIDEETVTQGNGDGVVGKDQGDDADKSGDDESNGSGDKPATPQASQSGATSAQQAVQKQNNKTEEATEEEKAAAANPYTKPVPQSEPGMGFPRVDGKTVDLFDGKTPHTHIRSVAGFTVPLTQQNYNEKTDTEIYEKLREMGYVS